MSIQYIFFLCIYYLLCFNKHAETNIGHRSEEPARELGVKLKKFFQSESQIEDVEKEYTNFIDKGYIKLLDLNPMDTVLKYSKQLGTLFKSKMESIERAVNFAEERAASYAWNPKLTLSDCKYIDAKNFSEKDDKKMAKHPLFVDKVVLNESSVHVPTEIYEGEKPIMHTIYWTRELDRIFNQNKEDLRYQYFASVTGVFRVFPGMKWRNTGVDMYDVRRRPWYVQGSSSPKNMLILIDTSGSMHGQSLQLTKMAVKKLIDTLGENDYVAVVQYPGVEEKTVRGVKYADYPHLLIDNPRARKRGEKGKKCFETFVQATKRNKDRYFKQLEKVKANGISNINAAIEFSYELFANFSEKEDDLSKNEGAKCNSIMVILTDGDQVYPRDEIRKYAARSKAASLIRIFTYSIGEQVNPTDELREMACQHRGFFAYIPAIGAVSNIIQKFVARVHSHRVQSGRQCEKTNCRGLRFNIFQDLLAEDKFTDINDPMAKGMGLMTSLTMPVYNRTGNQTLLGVMGTDVTVKEFMDLIPQDKLGPNGYAFAINTNGYIIFHPDLKAQRGWMRDPPNVDFLDVEFDSDGSKTKVRKKIIDSTALIHKNGSDDIVGLVKIPDEVHTYMTKRTYAFSNIPYSNFGVCVVNPVSNTKYPVFAKNIMELKKNGENYYLQGKPIKTEEPIDKLWQNVLLLFSERINEKCHWLKETTVEPTELVKNVNATSTNETAPPYTEKKNPIKRSQPDPKPSTTKVPTTSASTTSTTTVEEIEWEAELDNSTDVENMTSSPTPTDGPTEPVENIVFEFPEEGEELKLQIPVESMVVNVKPENILHTINTDPDQCDSQFVQQILLDLLVTKRTYDRIADTKIMDENMVSLVLSLNSGITMVWPKNDTSYNELKDNWKSSTFKRVVDLPIQIFWVPIKLGRPPPSTDETDPEEDVVEERAVTIFQSIKVKDHVAGILGIGVKQSYFDQFFSNCKSDDISCFILEDAGYIVALSDPKNQNRIGYFFGYVRPSEMSYLVTIGVYKNESEYDYQASCPRNNESLHGHFSDSQSLVPSFLRIIRSIFSIQLWSDIMTNIMNGFSWVLKFGSFLLFATDKVVAQEATATTGNQNVSCIKMGTRYYFPDLTSKTLNKWKQKVYNCNFYNIQVFVSRIEGTNLVMVVLQDTKPKTMHCNNITSMPRDPIEVGFEYVNVGPDICNLAKTPRYRRRPEDCYDFDPLEKPLDCASRRLSISLLSTFLSFLAVAYFLSYHEHW